MSPSSESRTQLRDDPTKRKLTSRQAAYLAEESGLEIKEISKLTVAEIPTRLQFHLDPHLLFFRRICGRVVRTNPATGEVHGVPFATVHVEDTDCSFLGLFPVEHPTWWWFWPVSCQTETIATVTTDECGNFCVYIPRWDIDRVLRFRRERLCTPIFDRPDFDIVLEEFPPIPIPDPGPLRRLGQPLPEVANVARPTIAPPLEPDMIERAGGVFPQKRGATKLSIDKILRQRAYGPFVRCHDVLVPEWHYAIDIPDITFRVTQDVDGDGTEEVIYDEGIFDVRWNDSSNDTVVLEASAIARTSPTCGLPEIPCEDVPKIGALGRMPVAGPWFDATTGYATTVNRPRSGGNSTGSVIDPGEAPFARDLQISACYHIDGAEYFRTTQESGGSSPAPILNETWTSASFVTPTGYVTMTPDADGWYPVSEALKQSDEHWVLNWQTTRYPDETYQLRLEVADNTKSIIATSDPVPVVVDNAAPAAGFLEILAKRSNQPWSAAVDLLAETCPIVYRPAGLDINVRVRWQATAPHFRSATVSASGCGGGDPTVAPSVYLTGTSEHLWHASVTTTGTTRTAEYTVGSGLLQGAYGFSMSAESRAFSPAGASGAGVAWEIDPPYLHTYRSFRFAVIDV